MPQAPQLLGSPEIPVQVPSQLVSPSGQVVPQVPFSQTCPVAQATLQAPQLVSELAVSTQLRPHSVVPAGHEPAQAPLTQTCETPHASEQEPQWLGSELRSVQLPRQLASVGQTWLQVLSEQASPPLHTVPTAPQLLELPPRFTQLVVGPSSPKVGAGTSLPGQVPEQAPLLQTSPLGQAWPHAPQLRLLVARETQRESHSDWRAGHSDTHEPPTHTWLEEQTVPQVPQLSGLLSSVAQLPLHSVRPPAQESVAGKSTYLGRPPPSVEVVFLVPLQARVPQARSRVSVRTLERMKSL